MGNNNKLQISLAAARVNAGMTQEESAKAMNVGKQTIASWERGESEPKVGQAMFLAELYHMPIDCIFMPYNPTKREKE